jgi:CBS domain-containing protein
MRTLHQVRDVMNTPLITVTTATPFKDVVALLDAHHISAVPVLDQRGQLAGLVSQADLLPKEAYRDRYPTRREQLLHLEELEKAGGLTAGDLMTKPVRVIGPHAPLSEAARLMARQHVRRLVVVDAGEEPIGIISRSDLLKVFLIPDARLAQAVTDDLAQALPGADTKGLVIEVTDGRVVIGGSLPDTSLVPALARIVRAVEGVVDVDIRLEGHHSKVAPPPPFNALY